MKNSANRRGLMAAVMLVVFLFCPSLKAAIFIPPLPLGGNFQLTESGRGKMNAASEKLFHDWQQARATIGKPPLPDNFLTDLMFGACVASGLCDGAGTNAGLNSAVQPQNCPGYSFNAPVSAGWECTGGQTSGSETCYSGAFHRSNSCSAGKWKRIDYYTSGWEGGPTCGDISTNGAWIVVPNPPHVGGILKGTARFKSWQACSGEPGSNGFLSGQIDEEWYEPVAESSAQNASQMPPNNAALAAQNMADAYSDIKQAKDGCLQGIYTLCTFNLDQTLGNLETGVGLIDGDIVGTNSGEGSGDDSTGSEAKPYHVFVDNVVTVKLQGDDGSTPYVNAPATRVRTKTFAAEYATVMSEFPDPPVFNLLTKLVMPITSTNTYPTMITLNFSQVKLGVHQLDLTLYGFWMVIGFIRFAVMAGAMYQAYEVIFG